MTCESHTDDFYRNEFGVTQQIIRNKLKKKKAGEMIPHCLGRVCMRQKELSRPPEILDSYPA